MSHLPASAPLDRLTPPLARPAQRLTFFVVAFALVAGQFWIFERVHAERPEALVAVDTSSYERPALTLVELGRFAPGLETPDEAEVRRTPGYPLFIATVHMLFGSSRAAVVRVQIALGVLALFFLYAGARRLGCSHGAALAAVVLTGLSPGSVLASQVLMTESLFTVLLMAVLYCALRLGDGGPNAGAWALAAGAGLAAATHVRPVAYYAIAPLLVWLWIVSRSDGRTGRATAGLCGALLLPWVLLVGGWQWRNAATFGDATFSHIQSVHLYLYRAAGVVALRDGISLVEAQTRLGRRMEVQGTDAERYEYYQREGMALLRAHPVLAIRSALGGLTNTLAGPGSTDLYTYISGLDQLPDPGPISDALNLRPDFWRNWVRGHPLLMTMLAVEISSLGLVYVGVVAAFTMGWTSIRQRPALHAVWCGCAVYLLAVTAGPEAYARFRVPVTPILACYGAYGWSVLMKRW